MLRFNIGRITNSYPIDVFERFISKVITIYFLLLILVMSIVLPILIYYAMAMPTNYAEDEPVYVVDKGSYWFFHHYFHDYYVSKRGFQISNNLTDKWAEISIGLNFTWNGVNISRITGGLDFRWKASNRSDMAFAIGRDIIFQNENYWVIFYIYYRIFQTEPYMRLSVGLNCSFPTQWTITNPTLFYRMENISISGSPDNDFVAIPENNGTNYFLPSNFSFDYNATIDPLQVSLWDNITGQFVEFLWKDQFWFNGNMHDILNHTVRGISNIDGVNGIIQVEWKYSNRIPSNTQFYHTWFWLDPTEVRYHRSDTASVNGLDTEKLRTSQSGVSGMRNQDWVSPEYDVLYCYWATDVFTRNSSGSETKIGTKIGLVSRSSVGNGIQSATWNCPETELEHNDTVVLRLYWRIRFDTAKPTYSNWLLIDTWQTERLNASLLNATTWTLYYYTYWTHPSTWIWRARLYFDTATYNTRIADFTYTPTVIGAWNLVESWTGDLFTRSWAFVESWTGDLFTRSWAFVESWTGDLFTSSWNLVEPWIGQLVTRNWNLVESWTGFATTLGWHIIDSWSGYLPNIRSLFVAFAVLLIILIPLSVILLYIVKKK